MDFKIRFAVVLASSLLSVTVYADNAEFGDDDDRINYSLGYQIGQDLLKQDIEFREQDVRSGMQDGYRNNRPRIDPDLMKQTLVQLKKNISSDMKQEAIARLESKRQQEQKRREESVSFLENHRQDPEVVVLDSGLQYKILKPGSGVRAAKSDIVTYNYQAQTMGGQVFDSTQRRGKPVTRRADQSIPGISQALQLMKPGGKWEVAIPSQLAYGRKGPLAHQAVKIELELIEVKKSEN